MEKELQQKKTGKTTIEPKRKEEPAQTKEEARRSREIADEYDIKGELIRVNSKSIRDSLTKDLIMAKIPQDKKDVIVEMTANAYYARRIQELMAIRATKWEWDKEEDKWTREHISKKDRDKIMRHAEITFESYMIRMQTLSVINRNERGNWIIEILTDQYKEDEPVPEPEGLWNRVKAKLRPKEEEEA